MRKRMVFLSIPLLAVVVVGLFFAAAEAQRTPDWRRALHAHVPQAAVVEATRAQWPGHFTPEMSSRVVWRGRFRYTDSDGAGQPQTRDLALPYPPQDVYCVLIRYKSGYKALFVNYYSDNLWNQDWIVHEGSERPFSPSFQAQLTQLGCRLDA